MYIKKLKRICDVRGCRCTESYAISLSREVGNSVIICRSCAEKALEAMRNAPEKEAKPVRVVTAAPLFYHPTAAVDETVDETVAKIEKTVAASPDLLQQPCDGEADNDGTQTLDPDAEEEEETDPGATAYVCKQCYRGFKTERGLKNHQRHCKE